MIPRLELERLPTQEAFLITLQTIINLLVDAENARAAPKITTDLTMPKGDFVNGVRVQ